MALINCPECGKQISDKAEKCIHCGFPIQQRNTPVGNANSIKKPTNVRPKKSSKTLVILGVLLLSFIAVMVCYFVFNNNSIFHKRTTLIPFLKNDGKYIFVDSATMKPPFEKEYDRVYPFAEGIARFESNGKWGIMNEKGKEIATFQYNLLTECRYGKFNGSIGFDQTILIDSTGKVIFQKQNYFSDFYEGLALIRESKIVRSDMSIKTKYGFIDTLGKEVVPMKYDEADQFREGLAPVSKGIEEWHPGGYYTFTGKYGFVDRNGNEVIPLMYESAGRFSEGLANISLNNRCGYINKSGKIIIPCQFNGAANFSEGMAAIFKNGKFGYIDKLGSIIIPLKYTDAGDFHEGLARVFIDTKCFFIKKNGDVISSKYDDAKDFKEGVAIVGKGDGFNRDLTLSNGKYGFIDKNGKEVIALNYDKVEPFSNGLAEVTKNDKVFYIDKSGKEYKEK